MIRRMIAAALLVLVLAAGMWRAPQPSAASPQGTQPPLFLPLVLSAQGGRPATPTAGPPVTTTGTPPTVPPGSTATITPTPSATPTATATMLPTATGTPTTTSLCGTYPVGVDTNTLNVNGFVAPNDPSELQYYVLYSDETYQNKTQRRLYLRNTSVTTGTFVYLNWTGTTTDTAALPASLTGTGNISQGYKEAPWPSTSGPNWPANPPASYPINPHQLMPSDRDWVYGQASYTYADLATPLQYHIDSRTRMLLPIYDAASAEKGSVQTRVNRTSLFLLRGFGQQSGRGQYLDLVYLSDSACP